MEMQQADILVRGAGAVGLATALALSRQGLQVALLGSLDEPTQPDLRAYALNAGAVKLLAQAYAKTQPDARITVLPSMGSGGGIKAVVAGAIQIAVSARPLSEAESKAGATAIEYGLIAALIAVAAMTAMQSLGTTLNGTFTVVDDKMAEGTAAAAN